MTKPLHNYLRTCRRRVGLSQDEVALLLGNQGKKSATQTGRHEARERLPSLEVALAYERIYGVAVKELFAGVYRRVEGEVSERARKVLAQVEKEAKSRRQAAKVELLTGLLESEELIAIPTWDE